MTPKQSVLTECKYCNNTINFHGCSSELCQLNNTDLPHVKRIKEHCLNCVPEQSVYAVKECDGKISSPEPHICPLHPYRLGKNPKRQEASLKIAKGMTSSRWIDRQFKKKETLTAKRHSVIPLDRKQTPKTIAKPTEDKK